MTRAPWWVGRVRAGSRAEKGPSVFHYERESRTPHSECYVVENEQGSAARADLHYTPALVFGTLCVPADWSEDDIQDVIADIDERIVRSADPFREDFVVTVWTGSEAGVYSDEETLGELAAATESSGGAR